MGTHTRAIVIAGGIALAIIIGVPVIWGTIGSGAGGAWGMMGPGMMWGGMGMGFGAIFMLLFWGLVIWVIVTLIQGASRPSSQEDTPHESALDLLKRRYARGEISKAEYEEKKRDVA